MNAAKPVGFLRQTLGFQIIERFYVEPGLALLGGRKNTDFLVRDSREILRDLVFETLKTEGDHSFRDAKILCQVPFKA